MTKDVEYGTCTGAAFRMNRKDKIIAEQRATIEQNTKLFMNLVKENQRLRKKIEKYERSI